MADPRNTVGFEGADLGTLTFIPDGVTIVFDATLGGGAAAATIGKAVSFSAGATVQLASDAEAVVGKLILVESDLKCTVQVDGCTTLPGGNGATLTAGTKIVGALGAASAKGFVRNAVASESPKQNGMILDATDTANVVINF